MRTGPKRVRVDGAPGHRVVSRPIPLGSSDDPRSLDQNAPVNRFPRRVLDRDPNRTPELVRSHRLPERQVKPACFADILVESWIPMDSRSLHWAESHHELAADLGEPYPRRPPLFDEIIQGEPAGPERRVHE